MAEHYKELDFTISRDDPKEGILKALETMRPEWDRNQVNVETKTDSGAVNIQCIVWRESDSAKQDAFVFRLNGDAASKLFGIDRANEIKYLRYMNQHGVGVPLLGSFKNGIILKYVHGRPITHEEMKKLPCSRLMAEQIARLHHITPGGIEEDKRYTQDGTYYHAAAHTHRNINNLPTQLMDPEQNARYQEVFPPGVLRKEFDWMMSEIDSVGMTVSLSHDDIHGHNVLYDESTASLHLIDYEHLSYDWTANDVGYFFQRCRFIWNLDTLAEDVISEEFRRDFVRMYLEYRAVLAGKSKDDVTQHQIEALFVQSYKTELFQYLSHAVMVLPLIEGAKEMLNEVAHTVDWLKLAIGWFKEYLRLKDSIGAMKMPTLNH